MLNIVAGKFWKMNLNLDGFCVFGTARERDSTQNPRNRSIPGWLFRHDAGQSKTQTYFDDKIVIKIVEDAENAAFNIAASYCFLRILIDSF